MRRTRSPSRPASHYGARVTLRPRVARDAGRLGSLAVAAGLPFGAVLLTGAVNGGYFPSEWGWPTLAFVLVCVLGVLVREQIELTRLEWFALGALGAFELWTLLSILWAASATEPVLAAERTLVYLLFLCALLLVASRATAQADRFTGNLPGTDTSTYQDGLKARAARAHARLESIGVPTPNTSR